LEIPTRGRIRGEGKERLARTGSARCAGVRRGMSERRRETGMSPPGKKEDRLGANESRKKERE